MSITQLRILVFIFGLVVFSKVYAALPTQEQLDTLCVPVVLKVDMDVHYFAVALIEKFDETGFTVKYGKGLLLRNFIKREDIVNWEEVVKKYKKVKGIQ